MNTFRRGLQKEATERAASKRPPLSKEARDALEVRKVMDRMVSRVAGGVAGGAKRALAEEARRADKA